MLRKSWVRVSCAISPKAPASSTPVGPPPTIAKVSRASSLARIGLSFGGFEGEKDAAADFRGVFDGLQTGSERPPALVAEIVMARTGCEHECVVIDPTIAQHDLLPLDVDVDDLPEYNSRVFLVPEGRAQR